MQRRISHDIQKRTIGLLLFDEVFELLESEFRVVVLQNGHDKGRTLQIPEVDVYVFGSVKKKLEES